MAECDTAVLRAATEHYRGHGQRMHEGEMAYFRSLTWDDAVSNAARAIMWDGSKHPHQQRRAPALLAAVADRIALRSEDLRAATRFDQILAVVRESSLPDFGPLTQYDTSLRIGAWLGIFPDRVYLHAGALEGAKTLGLPTSRGWLERRELPTAFDGLQLHEVEDVLCIYQGAFRTGMLEDADCSGSGCCVASKNRRHPPGCG